MVRAVKLAFGGTEGTGTNVVKEVKGVGETNFLYNVCVFMVKIRKKRFIIQGNQPFQRDETAFFTIIRFVFFKNG